MIAAWMVEATLAGLLFALGAWAAQRALSLHRGLPVRWLWAGALGGTLVLSAVWLVPSRHAASPNVTQVATAAAGPGAVVRAPLFRLPAVAPGVERALLGGWVAASLALAGLLLFAVARLGRERREWAVGEVGGARVALSHTLGPAAVGFFRPAIVLPRWVLTLETAAQRAIVAHEREHQRVRDPALLLAGLAAVVLMPWNAGVWMAWRGLRNAVEFDCDERVLRAGVAGGLARAEYARILLGAWGRTRASWLPSAALTRPSGLGSRVEHLMRPEPRGRYMKTFIGSMAALLLVVAACETPAPQRVVGPTGPQPSTMLVRGTTANLPLVIVDGVRQPDSTAKALLSKMPADQIASVEVLKGNAAAAEYGADARYGVILIHLKADTLIIKHP